MGTYSKSAQIYYSNSCV